MKRVSLVLRKEIPFPEIPCVLNGIQTSPKTPSQKTNQKKNGVHTNEKLSTIPTHIWACVDVKKPNHDLIQK